MKSGIEDKGGTVTVSNLNPSPDELIVLIDIGTDVRQPQLQAMFYGQGLFICKAATKTTGHNTDLCGQYGNNRERLWKQRASIWQAILLVNVSGTPPISTGGLFTCQHSLTYKDNTHDYENTYRIIRQTLQHNN